MNISNDSSIKMKQRQKTGTTVRILSQQELIADMRSYNRTVSKSRESALGALQRAGITDSTGQLSAIYRV